MNAKQFPADQRVIDCLNADYALALTAVMPLSLGADVHVQIYKACAGNRSYFVKLTPRSYSAIAPALQQYLHDANIPQIIAPIQMVNGQRMQSLDDYTVAVYSFIDAENGFNKSLSDEQWIMLGKALKHIHAIQLPAELKGQIKQEVYSPQWRDVVRNIYTHIDAKNVANDGAIYIIDWDLPIMAPKERDLMFVGGGVGNVWNNSHEEALFYQGYGDVVINEDLLAYYRYERIVEDIAEYGQQLLLSEEGDKERAVMLHYFKDMFAPNGVVDIACNK